MNGEVLNTLCTELNGGEPLGDTLALQLINLAKGLVEQRRPWMILRSTDASISVTAGNTWQTGIDLSTIERFNRFYESDGTPPIQLFDGNNGIEG